MRSYLPLVPVTSVRKAAFGVSLAVLVIGLSLAAWLLGADLVRNERYRASLEASLKQFPNGNSLSEDENDRGWIDVLSYLGIGKLSILTQQKQSEAYRLIVSSMGKSGVITVVLDTRPRWTAKILGQTTKEYSGDLGYFDVLRLRLMVRRCQFWKITLYPVSGGCDGSDWVIEGVDERRYRRVSEWSPERTYVEALGQTIAAMTVPDLTERKR